VFVRTVNECEGDRLPSVGYTVYDFEEDRGEMVAVSVLDCDSGEDGERGETVVVNDSVCDGVRVWEALMV
jgi:hypothetical protein